MKKGNKPKKVFVDSTDYCEESKLDTQKLINLIKSRDQLNNYVCTKNIHQADLIFYRACGHIKCTEKESVIDIKKLLRLKNHRARLIIWGCLPKINPASLKDVYDGPLVGPEECWDFFHNRFFLPREKNLDVSANTINNRKLPSQKENGQQSLIEKLTYTYSLLHCQLNKLLHFRRRMITDSWGTHKDMWYIKIVHGCKNSCTYCSDRLAYKTVKSQSIQKIVMQFEDGLDKGYHYFWLVGRDLGSYGIDKGFTLIDLVEEMIEYARVHNPEIDYKIILNNISPNSLIELHPKMKRILASGKIIHLGSHIQSGSNRILKLMGKNFSVEKWAEIISDIKKKYPKIKLETSIMVGFPSETDNDFERSVNLLKTILFDKVVIYKYNERPNLPSLRIGKRIPETIKNRRYYKMEHHRTLCYIKKQIVKTHIPTFSDLNLFINLESIFLRKLLRNFLGFGESKCNHLFLLKKDLMRVLLFILAFIFSKFKPIARAFTRYDTE